MSGYFDDLDTDPSTLPSIEALRAAEIRSAAHVVNGGDSLYDCWKCRGSGRWRPSRGFGVTYSCHACKGSGKVTKGQVAAAKGRETKARNWSDWCAENAELIAGLRRHEWNQFLRGLLEQIFEGQRSLTDRQVEAAKDAVARYDVKRAEKHAQEQASRSTEIGLSAIEALFSAATASGLKRPMFRAERLSVKQSRHAGVLYVYDREAGGERGGYAGKIAEGKFVRTREADPALGEALRAIAADPAAAAVAYGRSTGTCCLCGRELTDAESVKRGIGPICAGKWGI